MKGFVFDDKGPAVRNKYLAFMIWSSHGPRHAKTDLRANEDNEGPDQPARPRSLIWAFAVCKQNHWIHTECFNGEQLPG